MGERQGCLFEPTFNRSVKLRQADSRVSDNAGALLLRRHLYGLALGHVHQDDHDILAHDPADGPAGASVLAPRLAPDGGLQAAPVGAGGLTEGKRIHSVSTCQDSTNPRECKGTEDTGGVSEWPKEAVLKTAVPERVPWVRIPPPPLGSAGPVRGRGTPPAGPGGPCGVSARSLSSDGRVAACLPIHVSESPG